MQQRLDVTGHDYAGRLIDDGTRVTFSDSDETGHNYAGRLVDDGTISVIENQSLRLGQVNLWNPSSRSVLTLVFV